MDKISNIRKQYRKAAFLLTFSVTWSFIFFMLLSINSGEFATNSFQTVYAKNNQTEAGDIQKDPLVKDESLQKQDLINDDNKIQPRIITNPATNCGINPNAPPCCTPGEDKGCVGEVPQNCGINPNAPPCCTPGEDKGCVGNNDDVNILQVETNPQSLKTGDEFKVQATVINNLDVPIKYTGDQCGGSPLDIQFDKNVNINYAIACQAISTDTLGTHETTIVQGKGYEIFKAENPGKVNAQVTFLYSIEGDNGNQKQVSESFSFDIIR
ncbi:MAG TPA: hypothetical protein VJP58_05750 [Candidatus Nitrosocosmicus sp.]|nr:hypothetical protein [Candidatus Nitrosocosmicus sp.]